MICKNIGRNGQGHLTFAGQDTLSLAKEYGTPLYLMDEDRIRHNCRVYTEALKEHFGERAMALYAGKAASFKQIYRIMKDEGMGIDVVSSGEVYTASETGFPMENAYFHSNNKTDADIAFAMDKGVGYFVVDNAEELYAIENEARGRGLRQKVLLRLTPGIDPHTYAAVATGKVDSKFGSAIETGQAEQICRLALSLSHVDLQGFHCHIGSQVFDSDVYLRAAETMLDFIADMKQKTGYEAPILDLGGGYGVRYLEEHPVLDIGKNIGQVADFMKSHCAALGISLPAVRFEPGRSIVADAGMTLYTVGTIKRIPGYKNYVSVDGGMTDNPRYALYGSPYTVQLCDRDEKEQLFTCSVVGRCCESGDILQENVTLPEDIKRGDTLAVLTTGAYNYSMSSNYNRIPRPALVMLRDGEHFVAVKRETYAHVCSLDV